ncbi:MAG: cupin domain-containing protein [Halodesulfurarchaeum sp.]
MAEYSFLKPSSVELKPSKGSGTLHVDLVDELDGTNMRPKLWYLDPGDAMSFHRQTEQEEIYFVVEGPGRMRIEDEYHDVPEGTFVRVPPETRRQVLNDTDSGRHVWLVVGAPPTEEDGRVVDDAET